MKEDNKQPSYKIGSKFKDVSTSSLDKDAVFTLGVVVDTETIGREKQSFGIGLITPSGYHYSHLIYKDNYEGVTEISYEEFAKITANTQKDFECLDYVL